MYTLRRISMAIGFDHFVAKLALPGVILLLFGIVTIGSARTAFGQQTMNPESVNTVSSGNNQFAFDLFKEVATEEDHNILFSPVSISTALAMTYAGSKGETRKQIADVLHFTGSQQEVAAGFHSLMASMSQPEDRTFQLSVANALWAQKGVHFVPEFMSLMSTYYSGAFNTVDFQHTEQSLATINDWVAENTANKIQRLLHPDDISALTRLVLTNAVYLKAAWQLPFEENATKPCTFTTSNGAKKQASMMHKVGDFRYAQSADFQAVELPYNGIQSSSMVILLPTAAASRPRSKITADTLQKLRTAMKDTQVDLSLPKFKVDGQISLASTLSAMGVSDAFVADKADFSGITTEKNWYIGAVIHQAIIDVNEKGTEAAAGTAVSQPLARADGEEENPVIFRADHPFLYVIIREPSNSILFLGWLSDPTTQSP